MIKPPLAALSLLYVFLPEQERETIPGDLIEEFQLQQSPSWFWRQVLLSLGDLAWLGMKRSPGRTILAMLAGYLAMASAVMATFKVWGLLHGPQSMLAMILVELIGGFFCATLGGYLAARISRGSGINGIIGLCLFSVVMGVVSLATEPLWNEVAIMCAFVPGVLLGGYLRARQARS
jgi:hypothetical protein